MPVTVPTKGIFLPAKPLSINLHNIPSFYYLRIHVPTGHAYLEEFNSSHNVTDMSSCVAVPTPTQLRQLEELVRRWCAQGKDTWRYELCSLGDMCEILNHQREAHDKTRTPAPDEYYED